MGKDYLRIQIDNPYLFLWLVSIPSLSINLDDTLGDGLTSISMELLLPCYPEMRKRFAQDKRDGRSFATLDFFVRHFLREGSIFAMFGFQNLHENGILTELHFHDIQSRHRSMSEDLDMLDEAINKLEEPDIDRTSNAFMNESTVSLGFEHLYEKGTPTEPRFHDGQSRDHSMSEDLDDLEHAIKVFRSPLQVAIEQRDPTSLANVLVTDPATIDAKTLCLAIRHYEPIVFRLLLEHGAQVDGTDVLNVPLHRAAKAGHMEAVQLLLGHGANKEGNFCVSATPLTGAASAGHLKIVQYLVEEQGAFINGNSYKSPLSRAILHRHRHIVDYLLTAGADLCRAAEDLIDFSVADILGACSPVLHQTLQPRVLAKLLDLAAARGHPRSVRYLIQLGAHINPKATESPLWLAAKNGHLDTARHLIALGADITLSHGEPPLCAAARHGHLETVQYLLAIGANINPSDIESPLCAAARYGHLETVRYLIELGANVNPSCGESPLCAAARRGHLKVVRQLVKAGADVNTDLRAIYENDLHYSLEHFVPGGMDMSKRRTSHSPLGEAVLHEQVEVAHFLSSVGAHLRPHEYKLGTIAADHVLRMTVLEVQQPHWLSKTVGRTLKQLENSGWLEGEDDEEACPAVTAMRAQERRTWARRLILAKVARSRHKLLDAGSRENASVSLKEFVDQVGTSRSVFTSGTRAIRNIGEGYMPSSLLDVVSALQVANAMRSAVPPSKRVCSKKE